MPSTKDPLSAIAAYRQQAIYSTICTDDKRSLYWYLAADEATQFHHQTSFFKLPKTFSIHDINARTKIHQAIELLSSPKKKYQKESPLDWMFFNESYVREPLSNYRYWIARSLEITSPYLEEEKKTVINLLTHFAEGKKFLQEVLYHFETLQQIEQGSEKKNLLEAAILLHRAKRVAFTGFYLGLFKIQVEQAQQENKKKLLPLFKKIVHCLEQELALRKKILEATQQDKEDQACNLTLCATSWNSIKNCYQQAADDFFSNPKSSFSWHEIAKHGEKAMISFQRFTKFFFATPNKEAAGYLKHALLLLKAAVDFQAQTKGTSPILNQEFICWLKQASKAMKSASFLWSRAALIAMTFSSRSRLLRLWKTIAYYVEYKGLDKIQRIIARYSTQQAQQLLKNPNIEKKEYRKKIIQALLTQQQELAEEWRLAAEEASFFSNISSKSAAPLLSAQTWKEFLQQFFPKKKFLRFLYQISDNKKSHSFFAKNKSFEEAMANYRYWIIRTTAEKNRNLFTEPNWSKKLFLLHRSCKADDAAKCLESLKVEAAQKTVLQASFQTAVEYAEQVVNFRTKAVQATKKGQEWAARQWTLAAYTMEQAVHGQIQFFSNPWWKELSTINRQAAAYRVKAIKNRLSGHSKRASFFEKAAFLLEDRFDHELELRTSTLTKPKSLTSWKEVFDQTHEIAVLWATYATVRSWRKQFSLKRILRQKEEKRLQKIREILLQQISFCLPPDSFPDAAAQETWNQGKLVPQFEFSSPYVWIYQTWKFLQEAGLNYPLSTQPLEPGIVIGWGFYLISRLGVEQPFAPDVFLVDVITDQLPHPYAHLYLSQNPIYSKYVPHSFFMPHWPQRKLIPRDPKRGDRFENIAFFGAFGNCAEELKLKAWRQQLAEEFDVRFFLQDETEWHDYSAVDAVVAIRSFSKKDYFHKPATKLCNAWLAGVPFIAGSESAYAEAGTPGSDYLVATSMEELLEHLRRLKENPSLRHQLVEHGHMQVKAFTQEATLQRWKELLQTTIPAYAAQWQKKSALERRWFFFVNRLIYILNFYLKA